MFSRFSIAASFVCSISLATCYWLLTTMLPSRAPRRNQRGQVVRRRSSTGYRLTPTADLSKTERGPISTNGHSIFSISPNQAIPAEKSIRYSLLAAVGPLTILSWPEAINASRSKRACRMAISRNACSLLALPDFPEFAQAVRCGVPRTPSLSNSCPRGIVRCRCLAGRRSSNHRRGCRYRCRHARRKANRPASGDRDAGTGEPTTRVVPSLCYADDVTGPIPHSRRPPSMPRRGPGFWVIDG